MKITQSILSYLLFTLLLAVPPMLLIYNGDTDLITVHFWLIFAFLSGLTFFAVMLVLVVHVRKPDFAAQAFLAATTVKILACLIFIFIFLTKNKVNKLVFISDFFYIYLLNTAFEVYILLRNLRHKNLR